MTTLETAARRFWPGAVNIETVEPSSLTKRSGIDCWVHTADGRRFGVLEMRTDAVGILALPIERRHKISNRRTPGRWIASNAEAFVVVFEQERRARCWDLVTLRRAWFAKGRQWRTAFEVSAVETDTHIERVIKLPLEALPPAKEVEID